MSRGDLNRGFFGPLFILGLLTMSFAASADQTGDCTSGTQYCEDNGLTTINTTVTTNTNTNNNTNNNTNTNTNTNSNTNNNTNVNTNTNTRLTIITMLIPQLTQITTLILPHLQAIIPILITTSTHLRLHLTLL